MALPVTDGFVQTSGSTQNLTTYSAAWSILEGNLAVGSGNNAAHGTGATYNTARHNVETFNADQYSQVELTAGLIAAGEYGGSAVRCQAGANTSYHVETNGTNFYLSKCVAGAQTTMVGPVTQAFAAGDRIRLEVTGVGATVTLKVFRALAASPTTFTQVGTDYTDTAGNRIVTAGQGGIFKYGDEGTARITSFEAGNLGGGGGGEISGDAALDGPTAAGGLEGPNALTGDATLDGPTASGGMDVPNALTGDATLDGVTAGGGASGGSTLNGDAAMEGPTAAGGMSSGATGTLTSSRMAFNNDTPHSSAPFEAFVSDKTTGALVVRKTGLTSSAGASPTCSFADAAIVAGTQYRVTWRRTDTGAEGTELLTAT